MAEEVNRDESRFTRYDEAHTNSIDKGLRFIESMGNMAPHLGNSSWVNDGLSTLVSPDISALNRMNSFVAAELFIEIISKTTPLFMIMTVYKEDLCSIMELLSVKKHQARRLLMFHRWDKENLSAEFVEKGKTLLLAEAGVIEKHSDSSSSVASSITCAICFAVVPCDLATMMDCGHCFCNSCQSKHIRCMAFGCKYYCNEDVVSTLVSQRRCDMAEKFERFLLESYIEDNKRAKWCPSTPSCGNAICVEDDDGLIYEVECSCDFQFCFSCLSKPHSPCSCLMREHWAEKSANWIKNNTKPCPNCQIWLGGGDYEEQEEKAEEENQDESRFARYYHHFMNCLDKECRLMESIGKKAPFIGDSSWVNDGLSTLVRSWRVLSYSYPFAFYMFNDEMSDVEMIRKQNVFELYQQQLKENVEKLSKILEMPFESNNVPVIRMQVINLSAVIDMFCEGVYEFIQEDLLGSLSHGTHRIGPYKLLKP
ncbi:hypothetical protein K1719_005576 [Acacia pycnantha]|nr:hypothetical protein K1719_005576 [Acacia pycnantha]